MCVADGLNGLGLVVLCWIYVMLSFEECHFCAGGWDGLSMGGYVCVAAHVAGHVARDSVDVLIYMEKLRKKQG